MSPNGSCVSSFFTPLSICLSVASWEHLEFETRPDQLITYVLVQGDERVVLFVRLRDGLELDDELRDRIRKTVREHTTPRHVPAKIIQVADIPRTISGKIVELAVREVIHGRPVANVDALANPEALELYRDLPQLDD